MTTKKAARKTGRPEERQVQKRLRRVVEKSVQNETDEAV